MDSKTILICVELFTQLVILMMPVAGILWVLGTSINFWVCRVRVKHNSTASIRSFIMIRPEEPPPQPENVHLSFGPFAQIATSSLSGMTIQLPPPIVGGFRFGPKFANGHHFVFVTHYTPRWFTRKMMVWFFELYWCPLHENSSK